MAMHVQVIFLDSDNVAVADPAALLQSPEFRNTGALLWPDYWDSTAATDAAAILGLPGPIPGSFESGQLVFDKQRCVCSPCFVCAVLHAPLRVRMHVLVCNLAPLGLHSFHSSELARQRPPDMPYYGSCAGSWGS